MVRTLSTAVVVEPVADKVLGMVGLVVVRCMEPVAVVAVAGVMQRQLAVQAEHGVRMPTEAVEPLVHLVQLVRMAPAAIMDVEMVLVALDVILMATVPPGEFQAAEVVVHLATMRQEMGEMAAMEPSESIAGR